MSEVHGFCQDEFGPVRKAFTKNFEQGDELGAAAVVTHRGETVVDLWAGDADTQGRPWEEDTLINVWSITKTMTNICALMLADRGQLDLEAPVAEVWPEFGAAGKGHITTAQFMGHTAGLPGFKPGIDPTDLYDWDLVTANLATQEPWWEPGTQSGYHILSQGYLVGEVIKRVSGRSVGEFFRTEVAEPLGADFHIGLPTSEESRVGELQPPSHRLGELEGVDHEALAYRAAASCPLRAEAANTREWRQAEIPAAGGTGNARSVARVHAAIAGGGAVDGARILSPAGVEQIFVERSHGVDAIFGVPMRLGTGFGLMSEMVPLSPNPRSCYWGGWGGSICVIDVDEGLTVSYVMNRMDSRLAGDMRGVLLVFAAFEALANQSAA